MKHKFFIPLVAATLCATLAIATADEKKLDASKLPPAATATGVTYAKDIKPIFDTSCVKCHHGERPKGKLDLETLAGALKGGKEGKDIIPGKSTESPLVYAVAYIGDEDDFMPPLRNKANVKQLTTEQVSLIRAWIDQGAK